MVSLKSAVLAASYMAACIAVEIKVASSGGNATSGHQYGFLHEVRATDTFCLSSVKPPTCLILILLARISTTPATAASTPS